MLRTKVINVLSRIVKNEASILNILQYSQISIF